MPIYDFKCQDCGEVFEALVLKAGPPPCPACQGQKLEQVLSTFRVDSETSRENGMKEQRRKQAQTYREYQIRQREYEKQHHH